LKNQGQRLQRQEIERHFKLRECAEITGQTEAAWRRYVLFRKISYVRIGGSVRVPESELRRILEAGRVPAMEVK
jgi:hypothetical protein